jgi:hypothetical protein
MTVSIAEALVGDPWHRGQRLGAGLAASSLHPSEHVTENEQVNEGEPAVVPVHANSFGGGEADQLNLLQ